MTFMYCKLFASLYQGTLRGKSHEILVFTNLLAHADAEADRHPVEDEGDDEVAPAEGEDRQQRHHMEDDEHGRGDGAHTLLVGLLGFLEIRIGHLGRLRRMKTVVKTPGRFTLAKLPGPLCKSSVIPDSCACLHPSVDPRGRDRKSTRLNSSHVALSRMPSSA